MLHVEQRLAVAGTFTMPAVQALLHEVELAPVVVVPCTVDFVTGLSHHVNTQFPVFVTYIEVDAVSHVRSRVADHGTVGRSDFTVAVYVYELQVTRCNGCQCILG